MSSKAEILKALGLPPLETMSKRDVLNNLAMIYCQLFAEDAVDGSSFDMSVLHRLDSTRVEGVDASHVVHCQKVEAVATRILRTNLGEAVEVIGKRIYLNKQQIGTLDKVCIAYTLNEDKHVPRVHQREASPDHK